MSPKFNNFHAFIILIHIAAFYPCKAESLEYANKTILDSLQYITRLPHPDAWPWPYYDIGDNLSERLLKGDSLAGRILKKGEIIVPELIEKIKDTTETKINPYGVYYYTVSDIAIYLITYIYSRNEKFPSVNEIIISEFYDCIDDDELKYSQFLYDKYFFFNSKDLNYKNRLRFYNRIKKLYEEDRDFYRRRKNDQ
ncbi:MAG: hypothetical protein LBQ87_03840 [Candidatus Fibromonas sp.]|jgi:hypothetical protein|nr:hypothetical protein [Candidatus Fibromonas sp.]